MINWILSLFKIPIQPKVGYGVISSSEIQKLLPSAKKDKIYLTNPDLAIADKTYILPKKEQIEAFLKQDKTNLYKYQPETFDCDDFAMILLGKLRENFPNFAIGFAASEDHAFNFFIDCHKKVWIIEPQNDRIFTSSKEKYKIRMALL